MFKEFFSPLNFHLFHLFSICSMYSSACVLLRSSSGIFYFCCEVKVLVKRTNFAVRTLTDWKLFGNWLCDSWLCSLLIQSQHDHINKIEEWIKYMREKEQEIQSRLSEIRIWWKCAARNPCDKKREMKRDRVLKFTRGKINNPLFVIEYF